MSGFSLTLPPELVDVIAERVAEKLIESGALGAPGHASELLTVDEAAALLRVRPQGIYDRVAAGSIAPLRDGRRLLFKRQDLLDGLTGGAS